MADEDVRRTNIIRADVGAVCLKFALFGRNATTMDCARRNGKWNCVCRMGS